MPIDLAKIQAAKDLYKKEQEKKKEKTEFQGKQAELNKWERNMNLLDEVQNAIHSDSFIPFLERRLIEEATNGRNTAYLAFRLVQNKHAKTSYEQDFYNILLTFVIMNCFIERMCFFSKYGSFSIDLDKDIYDFTVYEEQLKKFTAKFNEIVKEITQILKGEKLTVKKLKNSKFDYVWEIQI